ncbi:GNAT family N-acetyltransferase [Clostridium sp.]|uniref:GNAT family N-acetyltransferase n=1 Tax=Clostridium sp. TaxID=1506 RepID=UPI003F2E2642
MKNLNLRDASESDAASIAELIYATEDEPEYVWGQGTKRETLSRIEWLVKSEGSRYSYTKIKVAELNGKICGAIILLKNEEIFNLDIKTSLKLVSLIKGIKRKLLFIKDVFFSYGLNESDDGEMYIANLATSPEVRGKGIGKELMKLAEKMAKENGYSKCSLLAKDANIRVFYEKLDYKFEREEKFCSHSLYKMIKIV